jgi:cytochrome c556
MKRTALIAGLAAVAAAGAALALDAEGQIKARHDYFHGIGKPTKALFDELKKPDPSVAEIQKIAAVLNAEAPKLPSQFPAGTGLDKGYKTGARPEIWVKTAEFKKDADGLVTAAQNLEAAAKSGNLATIKTAAGGLGGACKTCHETFRKEEH